MSKAIGEDLIIKLNDIGRLSATPDFIKEAVLAILCGINLDGLGLLQKNPIENAKKAIENIDNSSIQKSYGIIHNQMCILAVSALSYVIEKYFCNYIVSNISSITYPKDIKLSLEELGEYSFKIKENLGLIIKSRDNSINFQDVGSTVNTWDKYFNRKIELAEDLEKNIIFYQQCRHSLIHNSGVVDNHFLNKTNKRNANIKNYKIGEAIQLDKQDWANINDFFIKFIDTLIIRPKN